MLIIVTRNVRIQYVVCINICVNPKKNKIFPILFRYNMLNVSVLKAVG